MLNAVRISGTILYSVRPKRQNIETQGCFRNLRGTVAAFNNIYCFFKYRNKVKTNWSKIPQM